MIIIYALGSGRYPVLFDSSGSDISNKKDLWPAAHFGKIETVAIRPVKDDFSPYTKAELDEFESFDFGLDVDYDTTTAPKVRTTEGFIIEEVTEVIVEADLVNGIDEESITWAQITFTVDYGTDEAKAAIGTTPSLELKSGLNGYRAGQDRPGLIIQFPHLLLGRILEGGTGTPNPVEDGNYNSAQVDALLASKIDKGNSRYPATGESVFAKANVDGVTKKMRVNHNLGQRRCLKTVIEKESGEQVEFDNIVSVDDNNLDIDFTEAYDSMSGNYYLVIYKI